MCAPFRTEVLIAVARAFEAKPLISEYHLKRVSEIGGIEVFSGDDVFLIITGEGTARSAAGVGAFFGSCGYLDDFVALNIGLAAENTDGEACGSPRLVHKIVSAATGREFFPDMWFSSRLAEGSLVSVDRLPIPKESLDEVPQQALVDREAAGFFEAASLFLPPHRIGCVKMSTGPAWEKPIAADAGAALVGESLSGIEAIVDMYRSVARVAPPNLTREDTEWVAAAGDLLRLTIQQRRLLMLRAEDYRARYAVPLPALDQIAVHSNVGKNERKRRLAELEQLLLR